MPHRQRRKKFGYEPKERGPVRNTPDPRDFDGTDIISGRNPVAEAIKAGRPIEKILVQEGAGGAASKVISLAKNSGIRVERARKLDIEKLAPGETHQGIVAVAAAHDYASIDDIFGLAESRGEDPILIVLDGIEDPHNLGAILRSAECSGAHGVIVPKRNACGLTSVVAKASAGAIEYVPCAKVTNIARTIEELKERGVFVFTCDMDGDDYANADLTGPIAIVVGAEGKGVSRLVKKRSDFVISIPLKGRVNSLNASNAACVLMYEVLRQRG